MFESALGRSEASSRRLGTGAVLSGVVHALVAALVFIVPGKTKAQQEPTAPPVMIEFVAPKTPAGGPPAPAQPAPKTEAPAPQPRATAVPIIDKPVPEPVPQPDPPPSDPNPPSGNDTGANTATGNGSNTGGGTGGGTGGNGPGTGNGPPEAPPTPTVTELRWDSKMERPVLISGPAQPEYPRSAMLQHREGTVNVNCVIATDGAVRNCSIISGDVMLQDAALGALAQQRYRPFYFNGAPVSVRYMFRFTFKLQ